MSLKELLTGLMLRFNVAERHLARNLHSVTKLFTVSTMAAQFERNGSEIYLVSSTPSPDQMPGY